MHDGTIYDTDTQLSWLKDAGAGGVKSWADAKTWAASLNANGGFAGLTGWRLPNADTACTLNDNCINSEMGHIYYAELDMANPVGAPHDSGPFINLKDGSYWTGSDYGATKKEGDIAFQFDFSDGSQGANVKKYNDSYAWAVRSGARSY